MSKGLIKELDVMVKNTLNDEYLAVAYTIEKSLLDAGAKPGQDYSLLDLYKLAQPFVLERFKYTQNMEFYYPAKNVES